MNEVRLATTSLRLRAGALPCASPRLSCNSGCAPRAVADIAGPLICIQRARMDKAGWRKHTQPDLQGMPERIGMR